MVHRGRLNIEEVRDFAASAYLENYTGVTAVGITNPVKSIMIYAENQFIAASIPKTLGGFPIKVKVIGKVYTADGGTGFSPANPAPEHVQKYRPLYAGISIGNAGNAGTLGAVVFKDGFPSILSNNHVLIIDQDQALNIRQPGSVDGGTLSDTVGRANWWVKVDPELDNFVDAGLAKLDDDVLFSKEILDIGRYDPNIAAPEIGMDVQKSGRTTGHVSGKIEAIGVSVAVQDGRFIDQDGNPRLLLFKNLVALAPGIMIQSGDSGSVIWTKPESGLPKPVALAFASSDKIAFAAPMSTVKSRLGFSFSGKESTAPEGTIYYPRDNQKLFPSRFEVRGTTKDSSGIQTVMLRVDDGEYFFASPVKPNWSVWGREFTINTLGNHRIVAKIIDSIGNIRFVTKDIQIVSGSGLPNEEPPADPPVKTSSGGVIMTALLLGGAATAGLLYTQRKKIKW